MAAGRVTPQPRRYSQNDGRAACPRCTHRDLSMQLPCCGGHLAKSTLLGVTGEGCSVPWGWQKTNSVAPASSAAFPSSMLPQTHPNPSCQLPLRPLNAVLLHQSCLRLLLRQRHGRNYRCLALSFLCYGKKHAVLCLLLFHDPKQTSSSLGKKNKKEPVAKYLFAKGQKAGTDAKGKSLSDKIGHQCVKS